MPVDVRDRSAGTLGYARAAAALSAAPAAVLDGEQSAEPAGDQAGDRAAALGVALYLVRLIANTAVELRHSNTTAVGRRAGTGLPASGTSQPARTRLSALCHQQWDPKLDLESGCCPVGARKITHLRVRESKCTSL